MCIRDRVFTDNLSDAIKNGNGNGDNINNMRTQTREVGPFTTGRGTGVSRSAPIRLSQAPATVFAAQLQNGMHLSPMVHSDQPSKKQRPPGTAAQTATVESDGKVLAMPLPAAHRVTEDGPLHGLNLQELLGNASLVETLSQPWVYLSLIHI